MKNKYLDVTAEIASRIPEASITELIKYQELKELAELRDEIEILKQKLSSVDSTPTIEYA
jgi:protein-arginine kinase activator protein McsA